MGHKRDKYVVYVFVSYKNVIITRKLSTFSFLSIMVVVIFELFYIKSQEFQVLIVRYTKIGKTITIFLLF